MVLGDAVYTRMMLGAVNTIDKLNLSVRPGSVTHKNNVTLPIMFNGVA